PLQRDSGPGLPHARRRRAGRIRSGTWPEGPAGRERFRHLSETREANKRQHPRVLSFFFGWENGTYGTYGTYRRNRCCLHVPPIGPIGPIGPILPSPSPRFDERAADRDALFLLVTRRWRVAHSAGTGHAVDPHHTVDDLHAACGEELDRFLQHHAIRRFDHPPAMQFRVGLDHLRIAA